MRLRRGFELDENADVTLDSLPTFCIFAWHCSGHKDACLQLGNAGCQFGLFPLSPVLFFAG